MRRYAVLFIIISATVLVSGVLSVIFLELVPEYRYKSPSREVLNNEFYALEQWLVKSGIPFRKLEQADAGILQKAREKSAVVSTGAYIWSEENSRRLQEWTAAGANLYLYRDGGTGRTADATIISFLKKAAIILPDENAMEEAPWLEVLLNNSSREPLYAFHDDKEKLLAITFEHGMGRISVSNYPIFMTNNRIGEAEYAQLVWTLIGARDLGKNGILFIRDYRSSPALYGRIFSRGRPLPLILSMVLLILTGLWVSLSLFGRAQKDDEQAGRPISERFRSEALFLKRYKALDSYCSLYIDCIRGSIRRKDREDPGTGEQLVSRAAALSGLPIQDISQALSPGKNTTAKDLMKRISIYESILERIQ